MIKLLKEVDADDLPQIVHYLQGTEEEIKHHTDDLPGTQNAFIILTCFVLICSLIYLIKSREGIVWKGSSRLQQEHRKEKAKLFKKQQEIERPIFQLKEELNWVYEESKLTMR